MSRESLVFISGILLFVVPNLGIPDGWKEFFYILLAVLLMVIGYSLRHSAYIRRIEGENGERHTDSFVEHDGSRVDVEQRPDERL